MESEDRHLYGARMGSVPCAWSRLGASTDVRYAAGIDEGVIPVWG